MDVGSGIFNATNLDPGKNPTGDSAKILNQFQVFAIIFRWRDSLSCSPEIGKMAINLVSCTQYQTNKLNPKSYYGFKSVVR